MNTTTPCPPVHSRGSISALLMFACALLPAAAPANAEALAVLRAAQAKLASSPTLSVVARHKSSPEIAVGNAGGAPLSITVQRPNQFLARHGKGTDERVVAYDGRMLRVIFPGALMHGEAKISARDPGEFADMVDSKLGFRPPLAELLATDLVAEMAREGATITMGKPKCVGWTKCHHILVTQTGQTTELWIGVKDSLPRQYKVTLTALPGQPSKTTKFKKWKFAVPVAAADFAPSPPAGSAPITLLKSR